MIGQLEVTGQCGVKQYRELRRAMEHYMALQVPKESLPLLCIEVGVEKGLGADGFCRNLSDNDELATEFEVTINGDLAYDEQLRALAHEAVHVAQYFLGRMGDTGGMFDVYWLGKRVDTRHRKEEDLPWEREALHMEWTLLNSFRLLDIPKAA